jgi:hypothetical protein
MQVTILSSESVWGELFVGLNDDGTPKTEPDEWTGKPAFHAISKECGRPGFGHTRDEAKRMCVAGIKAGLHFKLALHPNDALWDTLMGYDNVEIEIVEL